MSDDNNKVVSTVILSEDQVETVTSINFLKVQIEDLKERLEELEKMKKAREEQIEEMCGRKSGVLIFDNKILVKVTYFQRKSFDKDRFVKDYGDLYNQYNTKVTEMKKITYGE